MSARTGWVFVPKLLVSALVVNFASVFALAQTLTAQEPSKLRDVRSKPNIVLVLADDLGINDLSCYGRAEHRTPRLDALAASGALFTTAYTAQPICSPSRAALMTGKCPARLHLTNYLPGRPDAPSQKLLQPVIEGQLPLEEPTLAEWLRGAGYATGLFGKWHLGNEDFGPEAQGFDVAVMPSAKSTPSPTEGGKGEYAITEAAEKFITEHRDQPFFCYVPHNNPHIPLSAKPELIESHADAFHPTYAAMIETLDDAVGRLISKVDELGLTERTIFIFTSDNGGLHVLEFPSTPATHNTPYRAGKGYVYEGGLREPLIVRWPGVIPAGKTIDTPVVLTDLVPTLLEAAGVDVAKTVGPLDGVSLVGLFRGDQLQARPLFWHFPNYTNQGGRPAAAMRLGDWKLVENFEDNSLELYNLADDPGERHNLAAQQADQAKKMRQQLSQWRTRVGAQMLKPNPEFDRELHDAIYAQQDSSRLAPAATAAATEPNWKTWRKAMNQATSGRKPLVTPAKGDIRLHAKDAIIHADRMRYEPESNKNVLGYWTNPTDWAEWQFAVTEPGTYEIEVQQGCGQGAGGSQVDVEVGGKVLSFTVVDTGHFQNMIQLTIGNVELKTGEQRIAIKPRTKAGVAVMDIRRIVLRPYQN